MGIELFFRKKNDKKYEHQNTSHFTNFKDDDKPHPLYLPLTEADKATLMLESNQDKVIAFARDRGTDEQTRLKIEILLKKQPKTSAMLAVEQQLRNFFREVFDYSGQKALFNSSGGLLSEMAVTTDLVTLSQLIEQDDYVGSEHVKEMVRIANSYGVSFHQIKEEEYNKALNEYREGKGVPLMTFVKDFSSVEVIPYSNKENGEFSRLVCRDKYGCVTFVNMSDYLPELHKTNKEIAAYISSNANDLQVVTTSSGIHILCGTSDNN